MVLVTSPCFSQGEQPNGAPWPQDDIHRVETYNRLVKEVGDEFPATVTVQDLYSMTCPHGRFLFSLGGVALRDVDGIHFAASPGAGASLLAPNILPLWEQLGHKQEASGGQILRSQPPAASELPPA
jgi:hypothetical protein